MSISSGLNKLTQIMSSDIAKQYGDFCDTGNFTSAIGRATFYCGITSVGSCLKGDDAIFTFIVKNIDSHCESENKVRRFLDKYGLETIDEIESDGNGFEEGDHYTRLPKYTVKVYISQKLLEKQASRYMGKTGMIPIYLWKQYNVAEIGPLYYVGRYNGGQYAFKYIKKEKKFIVTTRGVNSPTAWREKAKYETGRTKLDRGICYKMYTSDGETYWMSASDADKYFPDGLPGIFVEHIKSEDEE